MFTPLPSLLLLPSLYPFSSLHVNIWTRLEWGLPYQWLLCVCWCFFLNFLLCPFLYWFILQLGEHINCTKNNKVIIQGKEKTSNGSSLLLKQSSNSLTWCMRPLVIDLCSPVSSLKASIPSFCCPDLQPLTLLQTHHSSYILCPSPSWYYLLKACLPCWIKQTMRKIRHLCGLVNMFLKHSSGLIASHW